MTRRPSPKASADLGATRSRRTLRDVLHELPVDALVPDGWLVGCEVVQFGEALPADAVVLANDEYPRDLVVTPLGADDDEALAVHERDRVAGRRTVVAGVAPAGDDAAELEDGLRAAARAAARVETGGGGEATLDRGDPSLSARSADGRRLNFY